MPLQMIRDFLETSGYNTISEQDAMKPEFVGMRIFDDPVVGISDAADPMWKELQKEDVIGDYHPLPCDLLPGAKRVITVFFPYTEEIRSAARTCEGYVSLKLVHGRIEGAECIDAVMSHLAKELGGLAPVVAPTFQKVGKKSSTWSERHAAFIAGLGTFGINGLIITEKGCSGRLGSVIVPQEFEVTPRNYTELFERCIGCGACARRCPSGSIDPTAEPGLGKDDVRCYDHLQEVRKIVLDYPSQNPKKRGGCGFCQTGVPCEAQIPVRG